MKTKIIICYHKLFNSFKNEVLLPLHVGKSNSKIELENFECDNTGDNISYKNGSYCELTGLYWLWKNIEADNYGLFHYRRFLDLKNKYRGQVFPSKINILDWSQSTLEKLMMEYDVILPHKSKFDLNVYERYKKDHIASDLDVIIDIIKSDYPQYTDAINKSLSSKEEYSCNMFIMRKAVFFEYCEWLFDILQKAEDRVDITGYDSYQRRIWGFLSERMLNIFIQYKLDSDRNIKIKHVATIMINQEPIFKFNIGILEYINYPEKRFFRFFNIKINVKKKRINNR